MYEYWIKHWNGWVVMAAALAAAMCGHYFIYRIGQRWTDRTKTIFDDSVVRHSRKPMALLLPVVTARILFPTLAMPENLLGVIVHLVNLLLIASVAWLIIGLSNILDDVINDRFHLDMADNLVARQVHTQMKVIRRTVVIIVFIIAASAMLMTFPNIRQLGASLLASAGIAGLVLGMAARPALANLIAGVQIALTQPIRIDDVVIVEGEWGWIEQICTTYVVVRIWDLRRLILPLSYFNEQPFQNWTRESADILGTVSIYTDYTVLVEEIRAALDRILDGNELWDGKVKSVQVVGASEHTMEVRALISASNSGNAWNLRCQVRERLIEFLQQNYPEALPKSRVALEPHPTEKVTSQAAQS
jgi:small-conductance mechanosensitive channel